jgi:hypothetical protein
MFGDVTTVGLRLGNDGATGGGSVSLGVKNQSIAIVPVTYLDRGSVRYLSGNNGDAGRDALSVFASFDSKTKSPGDGGSLVQLGQIFTTGLAAQQVTVGYLCRQKPDTPSQCDQAKKQLMALEEKTANGGSNPSTANTGPTASSSSPAQHMAFSGAPHETDDRNGPYQAPLLFARTDVYGVDIGGSLAQVGLQFVLGYGNRNIALIPTTAQNANGRTVQINSRENPEDGDRSLDTLSVIGQFKGETKTAQLGYGLERYFATGMAARNIGKGLGLAIASDTDADTKNAVPPAKAAATGSEVTALSK